MISTSLVRVVFYSLMAFRGMSDWSLGQGVCNGTILSFIPNVAPATLPEQLTELICADYLAFNLLSSPRFRRIFSLLSSHSRLVKVCLLSTSLPEWNILRRSPSTPLG